MIRNCNLLPGPVYALALAACLAASCSFLPEHREPRLAPMEEVTHIEIHKSERRMVLFDGSVSSREFDIGLGSSPVGHKQQRGDGKTPVGTYFVDRRNPDSNFYLSLGLSYPNEIDKRVAEINGVDPGDNIFIHGEPNNYRRRPVRDWTDGCIAVSNREMAYIYRRVRVGTPVIIYN